MSSVRYKLSRFSYLRIGEGGEALVCNLQTGAALLLRNVAFMRGICAGESVEKIYRDLLTDGYDARADLTQIIATMLNMGLLQERDASLENVVHFAESDIVARFVSQNKTLESVHLDLTNVCTERCVHCYVPQNQHDYLPYAICEKVLREFREQQGLTAQLTGGECMMHPDFGKICRLCRNLDLNFIVMSNLTLCDEKVVALLKETDPQFVNVSLYSMDENEHDAITQVPGSWRKTRAAIDALQEAGVAVRLATPLLKANQKAYPALKAFADERRVHLVPDCDIIPRCGGDCSNLNYACTPEEVEAVLAGNKVFWDRGYGKNPNIKPEDKVCDIGKLLSVNSKGLYYPCSGMHEYVLGDARQVTLTDVWKGEKMNYLRGLKNRDFPQCVGCEHRAFCKVCPAFNFNATGSLFKTIPAKCAVSAVKHKVYGGQ